MTGRGERVEPEHEGASAQRPRVTSVYRSGMRPRLLTLLLSAALLAPLLASCGVAGATPKEMATANELSREVNAARTAGATCGGAWKAPVPALRVDPLLVRAAQDHSEDMLARGVLSHTGADGSNPGQRIARTGYQAATWGENAAAGYTSVASVMAGWLGSAGHCRNVMNPGVTEMGAGRAGNYWTMVFARPR